MNKELSPGAIIAVIACVVVVLGVIAWRVFVPHTVTADESKLATQRHFRRGAVNGPHVPAAAPDSAGGSTAQEEPR
jgi:hypothetical protein